MNSNLQNAMSIEEKYLIDRSAGYNNSVEFYNSIMSFGFESLEDYYSEKKYFNMTKKLKGNVIETDPSRAMLKLRMLYRDGLYGIVSVDTDKTCVHAGNGKDSNLDEEYCQENDIDIYRYDSYGGNIVATKGDYSIGFILPREIGIESAEILDGFAQILSKYLTDISIQGNDILYQDKKVCGTTNFQDNRVFYFIAHFSCSHKGDLIEKICGEPQTGKVPGYIPSALLPVETLKREVLEWLQGL